MAVAFQGLLFRERAGYAARIPASMRTSSTLLSTDPTIPWGRKLDRGRWQGHRGAVRGRSHPDRLRLLV